MTTLSNPTVRAQALAYFSTKIVSGLRSLEHLVTLFAEMARRGQIGICVNGTKVYRPFEVDSAALVAELFAIRDQAIKARLAEPAKPVPGQPVAKTVVAKPVSAARTTNALAALSASVEPKRYRQPSKPVPPPIQDRRVPTRMSTVEEVPLAIRRTIPVQFGSGHKVDFRVIGREQCYDRRGPGGRSHLSPSRGERLRVTFADARRRKYTAEAAYNAFFRHEEAATAENLLADQVVRMEEAVEALCVDRLQDLAEAAVAACA